MAVLVRFQTDERQQDKTSRLSSLLRSPLRPPTEKTQPTIRINEFEPVQSELKEEISFWLPSMLTAPRRDASHLAEANVAWELRRVALRVEGADALLARVSEDLRLVSQAMDKVRELKTAVHSRFLPC